MSDEPEVRPGPPWAMEEMIAAEPGLVAPVLALGEAAELAYAVGAALDAREPVTLVGCGTSEHAAMGGAAMLREALGAKGRGVAARDAFEAAIDPQSGGVVIAISHEGETPATLAAAQAAHERGARRAMVTARPANAPDETLTLGTPLRDTSWCHTVGYLSPLLALYAVAAHLRGDPPDAAAVSAAIEGALERRQRLTAAAATLRGADRLLAVGGGADEITARELALKIEEGVHVPVTPLGPEKVLHGHLPACDERTGLVIVALDARAGEQRDARARDVLAAAAELSMPSVLVGPDEAGPAGALPPVAAAVLRGALAAQLLTLGLVMAAGTNPDLIRREEPAYRAAAEAGGAG
jgi:fructoselysine-6-P-deglycase FrlB-like protein